MSWTETVKATALAALAGRTAAVDRIATDAPWNWKAHDVWLTRAKQPRELAAESPKNSPSTPPRQDTALPD